LAATICSTSTASATEVAALYMIGAGLTGPGSGNADTLLSSGAREEKRIIFLRNDTRNWTQLDLSGSRAGGQGNTDQLALT
jgi:hypothetical protein